MPKFSLEPASSATNFDRANSQQSGARSSRTRQLSGGLILATLLTMNCAIAAENPGLPRTVARLAAGERDVKIVCFGDSVTGIYYHTGGRRAYPEMLGLALQRTYSKAAPTIINAGVSGNTTKDALARIDKDVLRHKPQLVTIMFGLNDVVRVSPADFASNLAKIIDKCRGVGAEVLLCTPNAVENTPQRLLTRIAEYLAIIRRVSQEQKVPLADCWQAYEKVRNAPNKTQAARDFAFLMSDEIHPNMSGHKLTAETIAQTISGQKVSLTDLGPLFPAIPKTVAALKSGKPLTVLAMPPFDKLIGPALAEIHPRTEVKVIPWPTADLSLLQIERDAKAVRKMKVDLVIIAVPSSATTPKEEQYQRTYTWILNWSLSFGVQQWDCIAVPPSVYSPRLSTIDAERDQIARKLIFAQDLGMLDRQPGDTTPLPDLLTKWLREQMAEVK